MRIPSSEVKIHNTDTNEVNKDISRPAFSQGNEGLMELVGDGVEHSDDGGNNKRLAGNHDRAKSPKEKIIKDRVFSNMGCFLNKKIDGAEV